MRRPRQNGPAARTAHCQSTPLPYNKGLDTPPLLDPIDQPKDRLRLRARLRYLYHGQSTTAVRFRLGVIAIDLVLIAFFIATPLIRESMAFLVVDYILAGVLGLDMAARAFASTSLKTWISRPIVWLDIFVLATLLFPHWLYSLGFLRVLRIWTLFHSDFFWRTVGRRYDETRWEEVVRAAATLFTFVFVITGFVYAMFAGKAPGVNTYIDALYFTVTTLTTTGFGDVVLPGNLGKMLAIVTMLAGITLFVRFAQALVRPHKVRFQCQSCGLKRHDLDAVHCKACGVLLNIPNDEP